MRLPVAPIALLIAALLTLVSTLTQAAAPPAGVEKMDRRMAVIAQAAADNRADALMSAAIGREMFRRNTPFDARWNAAGQVQVYLHYDRNGNAPNLDSLKSLGATDIVANSGMGVVQAWIPATALAAVASIPEVNRITVPRYAVVKRAPAIGAVPDTGSKTTEGDSILGAANFRQVTGLTGKGSVVGVISNNDTNASKDVSTGDLPANIWDDPNDSGSFNSPAGDEGTAIMEIVYDLAPGVDRLGFCGPQTDVEFVTCLNDFVTNISPTVIVDDLSFPGEAMFSDGSFATNVQTFANTHPTIRLVTAAGNDAEGFWAGTWNPMAVTETVNTVAYTQAQNFGAAGACPGMTAPSNLPANSYMCFQVDPGDAVNYLVEWDDPWDDTSANVPDDPNDYDVVMFDSAGAPIACNQGKNINPNNGTCTFPSSKQALNTPGPTPVQGAPWQSNTTGTATVYLQVFFGAGTPGTNLKILVFSQNSHLLQLNPNTPTGGIFAQSALPYPAEITVGAVPSSDGICGGIPGTLTSAVERYSSLGPVMQGFSGQAPTSRMKPDFVAPDGVTVTGVGGFGVPFCGTSAAAPHVAGLLALLGPAYPNQTPYDLLKTYAAMPDGSCTSNCTQNGVFGYGLPNLTTMLNAGNFPPPTAVISTPASSASLTTGSKLTFDGSCNTNGASATTTLDWNFGTAGVSDSNQANPTVTFSTVGTSTVTLSCTNALGASSTSVKVTVTAPSSGGGSLEILDLVGLLLALNFSRRRIRSS